MQIQSSFNHKILFKNLNSLYILGGYLALRALALYPNIFKISIAGAPVTSWILYDTAYTERYLGLPEEYPEQYIESDVLHLVKQFSDE